MERLGGPKTLAAERFQPELRPQFLDPVFDVGAAVVTAPHGERVVGGWQVGRQRLEPVAGNLQQRFAASRGTLGDPLAHENQAPAGPFAMDLLDLDAGHLGRPPMRVVMAAERLDWPGEPRHEDELHSQRLGRLLHVLIAKVGIAADQPPAHLRGESAHGSAQELRRAVGVCRIAAAQGVAGDP